MVESNINEIFGALLECLPEGWQKALFHADFGDRCYHMFFYVRWQDRYYSCYELEKLCGVTRADLVKLYTAVRKLCGAPEKWSGFDLTFRDDMTFTVDYEYEPFDEGLWKERYLT